MKRSHRDRPGWRFSTDTAVSPFQAFAPAYTQQLIEDPDSLDADLHPELLIISEHGLQLGKQLLRPLDAVLNHSNHLDSRNEAEITDNGGVILPSVVLEEVVNREGECGAYLKMPKDNVARLLAEHDDLKSF
jgi:hypothetical protein